MGQLLRRIYCRFPGYRRKLSAQKGCTLRLVPTEIVDLILEHLPPESVVAFALTCRALYGKHFPKPTEISVASKERLLQLIERDLLNLYFCYGCIRLHPWRPKFQNIYFCREFPGGCGESIDCPCPLPFQIGHVYSWARLVMNRHFYGLTHGPDLKKILVLQRIFYFRFNAYSRIKVHWDTKVIENKLYLHGTMVFKFHPKRRPTKKAVSPEAPKPSQLFIRCCALSLVCRHLRTVHSSDSVEDGNGASHPLSPGINSLHVRSCPKCYTDCQMRLTSPSRRGCWGIKISTWHRLGACRSPHEEEWRCLVGPTPDGVPVRKNSCGPGAVYGAWMEGCPGSADQVKMAEFIDLLL